MDRTAFVAVLGGIFEHSPWVAERAFGRRPFVSVAALHDAMRDCVDQASEADKLALINQHPDLAGKLARAGALGAASANEQQGLGLDRLSEGEFNRFETLNKAYRAAFGFPFIIAARNHTRASVLAAFEQRLRNDLATEKARALVEIAEIARFRLTDLIAA